MARSPASDAGSIDSGLGTDERLENGNELGEIDDRLGDVSVRTASGEEPLSVAVHGVGGRQDDGDAARACVLLQFARQIETGHLPSFDGRVLQRHIHENENDIARLAGPEQLDRILGSKNLARQPLRQQFAEEGADVQIILDDDDPAQVVTAWASGAVGAPGRCCAMRASRSPSADGCNSTSVLGRTVTTFSSRRS